jgi:hypothetical protein
MLTLSMGKIGKTLSLSIVVFLTFSSILTVETAFAQSSSKPSVPEFTVKFMPSSYTVTTTDQYTGEIKVTQCDNSTIEVKIKNQLFPNSINGVNYYLFYDIRVKGHFSDSWRTIYETGNYSDQIYYEFPIRHLPASKTSTYAVGVIDPSDYPANAQIDCQVMAVAMYDGLIRYHRNLYDFIGILIPGYVLGQTSGWSSTQTLTIPQNSINQQNPTTSPTISDTPTTTDTSSPTSSETGAAELVSIPLSVFTTVVAAFMIIIIVLLVVIYKKPRNIKS